ncbi:AraC family transcriptional regulator [Echinicola sp. CAU 1574]|uniref:AraC family transcriptional regulator n=1 Tax=Echinicola arenosa TaxID=2774144 RepID=A0ABR9ARB9_9BACT|nr:helix-turn-helix domain-containing protein [Echinicola arenosa]MBD8490911.1 AraC family transcriptional regulator [Echinicola arenosa]
MSNVLITIIIQCLISVFLIYNGKNKNQRVVFLLLYLLVISFDFIHELFINQFWDAQLSSLEDLPSSFRFLKGPLLYAFITIKRSKKEILLHATPFFITFALNISILVMLFLGMESLWINDTYSILHQIYPYYWLGYILFCTWILFFEYKEDKSDLIKYTRYLLGFLLFTVGTMLSVYMVFTEFSRNYKLLINQIYSLFFLVQFALILVIYLKGLAKKSEKDKSSISINTNKEKYSSSTMSVEEMAQIVHAIQDGFDKDKLHLNEDLTINQLAAHVDFSRHQVTEAISTGLKTNFYDLLNSYKIKTFINLFEKDPEQSITDVFYKSGFKSKATFYKYFKLHYNKSPREFKAELMKREKSV